MRSTFHAYLLVTGLVLSFGAMPSVWAEQPAPDLSAGKAAYQQSCARCHGAEGRGDGLDAKRFYPRPRDFTLGVYKFRSTMSGTPPTDEDLFETITRGLPGSNMPDWQHLDEATRWQIVYYLKSLSPVFEQTAPEPVTATEDPGPQRADLAKGRAVYEQMGCAKCHGDQGRANGMSAAALVDDWGMPIRPANLTQGWNYRGWSDPRSVMLRFLTGIDGSQMPSYAGTMSPEDAWHLAYYVASLQETPTWRPIVHAAATSGPLPEFPDDARWEAAEQTDLRVRHAVEPSGTWTHAPTVTAVAVRVLASDAAVAIRLTWDDPTENTQDAADQLAVMLRPADVQGDVVTLQLWPAADAPRLDLCLWSAARGQAHEVLAADVDRAMTASDATVGLASYAQYDDGRWSLVMHRPLRQVALEGAEVLDPGRLLPLAVVVWDGANHAQRTVSSWVELMIESSMVGHAEHLGMQPEE
jgi:cytochrome c oxidase cbb3-type subunit 2